MGRRRAETSASCLTIGLEAAPRRVLLRENRAAGIAQGAWINGLEQTVSAIQILRAFMPRDCLFISLPGYSRIAGPVAPSKPMPESVANSASLATPSAITFMPMPWAMVETPRRKAWLPGLSSMPRMKLASTLR